MSVTIIERSVNGFLVRADGAEAEALDELPEAAPVGRVIAWASRRGLAAGHFRCSKRALVELGAFDPSRPG